MTAFLKGDWVRLKSGGPKMRVTNPDGGLIRKNQVMVVWLDDVGHKHERHFYEGELERTDPAMPV
ncbi:DUF2158 domain-containing protein [Sphingomonas nostoxanthinifaciens]|uniref:DUF2158 domain-containing protein n=1 Tax=Sphingomonas nostoxanthinifaciens TaxID=2872652 RepID=UPI001CC1D667|nr:DUF2158 domain-containing protein [Sphingomonas nostoxanthinifaciens]UAK25617.1 DUF2158 domain-containing protein [Sphingomonas nostoxanthinifaciens]